MTVVPNGVDVDVIAVPAHCRGSRLEPAAHDDGVSGIVQLPS